jgi:hypothetical protein
MCYIIGKGDVEGDRAIGGHVAFSNTAMAKWSDAIVCNPLASTSEH